MPQQRAPSTGGLDPQDLAALAVIGAEYIVDGNASEAKFTEALVNEFGEASRPHASAIFAAAKTKLANVRRELNVQPTPKEVVGELDPNDELTNVTVFNLATAFLLDDVPVEGVMKKVHEALQEVYPSITYDEVSDMFTGYGKAKYPDVTESIEREQEKSPKYAEISRGVESTRLKLKKARADWKLYLETLGSSNTRDPGPTKSTQLKNMSDYSIDSNYRFALLQSEKVCDRLSKCLADKTYIKSTFGSYISLDDIGVSSRSDLVKSLLICIAYHHYSCVVVLSPNRKSDKPIAEAHLNSIDMLDGLIFQIKLGTLSCHTNLELSILKFAKGDRSNEYEAYKKLKAMEASDNLKDTIIDTHEFYKQLESLPKNEQYFPQAFKILNIDPVHFNRLFSRICG